MRLILLSLVLFALGIAVTGASPLNGSSGEDLNELPHDLGVLYGALDRADRGEHRELYTSAEALAAVRDAKPLPPGTELVMIVYAIARDAAGTPIANSDGAFIKQRTLAYLLMRKRGVKSAAAGTVVGGDWKYQIFGADRRVVHGAKLTDCAACHERRRDQDFVFSHEEMMAFAGGRPAR